MNGASSTLYAMENSCFGTDNSAKHREENRFSLTTEHAFHKHKTHGQNRHDGMTTHGSDFSTTKCTLCLDYEVSLQHIPAIHLRTHNNTLTHGTNMGYSHRHTFRQCRFLGLSPRKDMEQDSGKDSTSPYSCRGKGASASRRAIYLHEQPSGCL